MRRILLLVVIMLTSWTARASSFVAPLPLVEPPRVDVPQGLTAADEESAILAAAEFRSWKVVDRQPGAISLKYPGDKDFSATVSVVYEPLAVTISYKDSIDLDYDAGDGHPRIHPSYMRWTNNLAHDIRIELLMRTLK